MLFAKLILIRLGENIKQVKLVVAPKDEPTNKSKPMLQFTSAPR